MLRDIQVVGGSVLTLFLMMAVGLFLGKLGKLSKETLSQLSSLLLYVVCPAIMMDTFMAEARTEETVRALLAAGAVMVGTYLLNMLLIQPWFRKASQDDRGVMRFASIYGNTGFMGLPLIQAVLGDAGMLAATVTVAVFNIAIWTHGGYLMGRKSQVSLKKAVLNPGVIGFSIAVALFAMQIKLPGPAASAVGYVADLNTPLAMVVIGGQMASVNFRELFGDWRLYAVSAIKLLAMPMVTLLALLPFAVDPVIRMTAVILAGCPVAGATSLFCQMAGKDTSLAARLVTVSTVLCILTLPVVVLIAK